MKKILALLCLIFVGCAVQPQYNVTVSSLAAADIKANSTYYIFPGAKEVSIEDLQFQEYASYVRRALEAKGYVAVNDPKDADIAIMVIYGIGEPKKENYTYSLPVWGQTGIASSSTIATANTYGNQTQINATTNYTPSYGITGYNTHTATNITYDRYVEISAIDLKHFVSSNQMKQIWQTTLESTGWSGDLRKTFPIMLAAALPYLATNTGQKVLVSLKENSQDVLIVKGTNK